MLDAGATNGHILLPKAGKTGDDRGKVAALEINIKEMKTMVVGGAPIQLIGHLQAAAQVNELQGTLQGSQQFVWINEETADEVTQIKQEFSSWLAGIEQNKKLFEMYVYKNPNFSALDLRQHRSRLFALLGHGEHLYVKLSSLQDKLEPSGYLKVIDENLKALADIFNAWHAPLDAQADIPQSFKDAVKELKRGEIEPLV